MEATEMETILAAPVAGPSGPNSSVTKVRLRLDRTPIACWRPASAYRAPAQLAARLHPKRLAWRLDSWTFYNRIPQNQWDSRGTGGSVQAGSLGQWSWVAEAICLVAGLGLRRRAAIRLSSAGTK